MVQFLIRPERIHPDCQQTGMIWFGDPTCVLRRVLQTSSGIVMVAATAPAIPPEMMWDLRRRGGMRG